MARFKPKTPFIIIVVSAVVVAAVRVIYPLVGPPLLVNTTDSEPHGVYWLEEHPRAGFNRGDMVSFAVPEAYQSLVYGRQWLAPGSPLIKGIGGLAGDTVCVTDTDASVNGNRIGPVFETDSQGRAMPIRRGCERVPVDYFFPFSDRVARSFDGRYMGPRALSVITGKVHPLWIF